VFEMLGSEKSILNAVNTLQSTVIAGDADLTPERRALVQSVRAATVAEMPAFMSKVIGFEIQFYATNYTEDELAQMVVFYTSPTGRDIISKAPLMAAQLGGFVATQIPMLRADAIDHYCAKSGCSDVLKASLRTSAGLPAAAP
jgi:hypothetical protein